MTRTSREVIQVFLCCFAFLCLFSSPVTFGGKGTVLLLSSCLTWNYLHIPQSSIAADTPYVDRQPVHGVRAQGASFWIGGVGEQEQGGGRKVKVEMLDALPFWFVGFLSGIIRQNWNDTEKISMAPAQGWHAKSWSIPHFLSALLLGWIIYHKIFSWLLRFSNFFGCFHFFS